MLMSVIIRAFQASALTTVGALALGGAILWQVAAHTGPPNGTAYVHVCTPQVDVMVDEQTYAIQSLWDSPIVCELRPGKHKVQMSRNGQTLFAEEFTLKAAEHIVVTAWERSEIAPAKLASP
jgi:hypothetical protein